MAEARRKESAQEAPAQPAAVEKRKDGWVQWVALTTTILAVCAAISALKGGGYSTQVQLATTQEANAWAFFQAKSLKQHVSEQARDALAVLGADARSDEARKLAQTRLAAVEADVKRYGAEKAEIQARAEGLGTRQVELKRHGAAFGMAVMLLQIAIMLSSVGALIKKPSMWVLGLCCGAAGLVYMANGFWLFFG